MKGFLQKLNPRLILICIVAFWLFICAFKVLSYLKDFGFLHDISVGKLKLKQIDANRLSMDMLWFGLSNSIGLLIVFLFSLFISKKNQWYWINALIAFIICFLIARFQHNINGYNPAFYFNYFFGAKFGTYYIFIFSSVLMLSVALVLLLNKRITNFINAGASAPLVSAE
jgi:uncharacterized membrane protein YjjP (DUF1212 family)